MRPRPLKDWSRDSNAKYDLGGMGNNLQVLCYIVMLASDNRYKY